MSIPVLTALEGHPAFKEAHTVLLYYSLPDEVHTHAFVEKWKSAKRILLPVVVGNEPTMPTSILSPCPVWHSTARATGSAEEKGITTACFPS